MNVISAARRFQGTERPNHLEVDRTEPVLCKAALFARECCRTLGRCPVKRNPVIQRLFRALPSVPVDLDIGRRAGSYMLEYRKSHGLQLAGALIAATAGMNGAEFWTRNRKHYPMAEIRFF